MNNQSPSMFSRGKTPLATIHINDTYLLGIYQGALSKYDILLRYRQKEDGRWSRVRTPKHIHWAVDMLIKHYCDPKETDQLLDSLIALWRTTAPIKSLEEQNRLFDEQILLADVDAEASKIPALAGKGEYSVKFLVLVAKLLMAQEKTNRCDAYMFEKLLEKLKDHKNIFEIVSAASFNGR